MDSTSQQIINLIKEIATLSSNINTLSQRMDAETRARQEDVKTIRTEISKLQVPFKNGPADLWKSLPRYQKWGIITAFWGFWLANVDGIANTFYKVGDLVKLFGGN